MKKGALLFILIGLFAGIACAQVKNSISNADKVYGLSKFWQEVNYNFVYFDKVDHAAWDSLYRSMIVDVQKTPNDYEYYRLLQRFCAFLKDGHTNVNLPQEVQNQVLNTMFGKYRLFIQNIDGHAVITNTNLSIKDEVPVGSEIITVNGLSAAAYANQFVKPYISESTGYVLEDQAASVLLQGLNGSVFDVQIKTPAGAVKQLHLVHQKTDEKELYSEIKDLPLFDFKWYPNQTAYLALNSFEDQKIDTLFEQKLPELLKAKSLIIDLRNNGGGDGSIGLAILEYLTNDKLLYSAKSITRLHAGAYKAWGSFVKPADTARSDWAKRNYLTFIGQRYLELDNSPDTNTAKGPHLVVPTVILIGHHTASAAEDFLIYADKQKHMIKMGENSFGSTGQPLPFDLPGGGHARVCTKKDTYPDGREFVGVGVKPDVVVKRTLSDYLQGKDPVLEKAIVYMQKPPGPRQAAGEK